MANKLVAWGILFLIVLTATVLVASIINDLKRLKAHTVIVEVL